MASHASSGNKSPEDNDVRFIKAVKPIPFDKMATFIPPPLDPMRKFCISATKASRVIGTSRYGNEEEALSEILGIGERQSNENMRKGVFAEPHIADEFQTVFVERIMPEEYPDATEAVLVQPKFVQHSELRFLGASLDRVIRIVRNGKLVTVGAAEIKYRSGFRENQAVDLQRKSGDPDYRDQCYHQMMCADLSVNWLVVRSAVNLDYWKYIWHDAWWEANKIKLVGFYDLYLRWFWEQDRSEVALAPILDFMKLRKVALDVQQAVLRSKPSNLSDIDILRRWRQKRLALYALSTRVSPPSAPAAATTTSLKSVGKSSSSASSFSTSAPSFTVLSPAQPPPPPAAALQTSTGSSKPITAAAAPMQIRSEF